MKNIILRPNVAPVYGFLSMVNARQSDDESGQMRKIRDCGAGGMMRVM